MFLFLSEGCLKLPASSRWRRPAASRRRGRDSLVPPAETAGRRAPHLVMLGLFSLKGASVGTGATENAPAASGQRAGSEGRGWETEAVPHGDRGGAVRDEALFELNPARLLPPCPPVRSGRGAHRPARWSFSRGHGADCVCCVGPQVRLPATALSTLYQHGLRRDARLTLLAVCCEQPMQQTLDELDFERGLCGASFRGDLARVQELLDQRMRDPNERDLADYTPLHYAARHGHAHVCALLLRKRAAVDATAGDAAATPLHRACAGAHVDVAELLLRHRASPGLQDADGENCLHKAARTDSLALVNLLIGTQTEVESLSLKRSGGGSTLFNACNVRGLTPCDVATDPHVVSVMSEKACITSRPSASCLQ